MTAPPPAADALDAARTAYLRDGWAVLPALLDDDEIAALHAEILALVRGGRPSARLPPLGPEVSDADALSRVLCVFNAHHISPLLADVARRPAVAAALAALVGAHLPWWDGAVKAVQSQVFIKPPGFQGMAWHQDEAYIPTRDRSLCAIWIALDPINAHNGGMRVLSGSHRTGYLWPQRDHGDLDQYDYAPEAFGFDPTDEVTVSLRPGDALFLHGYTLHRSTRNDSDRLRRVLSFHTMNAWSLLPWLHPRGLDPVSKADVRSVWMVSGDDPYAWKGTAEAGDVAVRTCRASEAAAQRRQRAAAGAGPSEDGPS